MFYWNSLAFSMIQQMLSIWSLVPLPFLKPAWTSGSSGFTYCWSLSWRILSITLLACAAAAAAKSLQSCPTLCDTIDGSPPGCPIPDSPGKSTGVGCHCLLQSRALRVFKQVCWTLDRLSHFFLITLLQNKGYNFLYFTYKHLLFAWHLKPQTKMIQTDTVVTFLESTLSWRE